MPQERAPEAIREARSPGGAARQPRAAALLVCLLVTLLPPRLESQTTTVVDPCDPKLVRSPSDPLAYGLRGDRCEGIYIKEVAGSGGLLLAAFTEPFESFEVKPGDRLTLEWSAPDTLPVRLRALSLRRRLYYRMDAVRPAGTRRFEWPADVLASLEVKSPELGIVGWVEQRVGARTEDVYVPVRLGRRAQGQPPSYLVAIVPGTDLAEVYLTLSKVAPDGRDELFLKRDEPLKYGYYPAERPIMIPLRELPSAGIYRLHVGALLSRGGPANASLHFYHTGR
jgi:hypothetical protein